MAAAVASSSVASQVAARLPGSEGNPTDPEDPLEQVAGPGPAFGQNVVVDRDREAAPVPRSWPRIRRPLGITEPLPEEVWSQHRRKVSDEIVAALGACLAAVRQATLANGWACAGRPTIWSRQAFRSSTTAVTFSRIFIAISFGMS
jgi:hypothetical protein